MTRTEDRPPRSTWPAMDGGWHGPFATVTGRLLAAGLTAVVLAALVLPWRPATVCLLRGLTGLPCPFCGGTTALVELGHGHLRDAVAASPLALVVTSLWVAWPRLGALRRWPATIAGRRATRWAVGVALLASELWQLHRYGWLPAT